MNATFPIPIVFTVATHLHDGSAWHSYEPGDVEEVQGPVARAVVIAGVGEVTT